LLHIALLIREIRSSGEYDAAARSPVPIG
jgi:hypothetical protein